jgi:hypothetical protein
MIVLVSKQSIEIRITSLIIIPNQVTNKYNHIIGMTEETIVIEILEIGKVAETPEKFEK